MLKIAGWVITPEAAEAWVASHPEVEMVAPKNFLKQDNQEIDPNYRGLISTNWLAQEKLICLLTRRFQHVEDETWDKFKPIQMSTEDVRFRKLLEDDGLVGELEWITVPDPFEEDWPFHKRYPGSNSRWSSLWENKRSDVFSDKSLYWASHHRLILEQLFNPVP
ncbi:hypothetical protein BDZ94DRAFT_1240602 [Collybia nuda]|uniref:Uncharacterized protein n=1 Tax=Collybia nuda TaxID=64659 RepID=A0A9P5XVM9_9AGAR|nr:hypothetical protein BDZ94DRAFT_1240602 [Collybia nuda]